MDRKLLQQAMAQNSHFTPTRKVSLYSNFSRLEETNPDGYAANVTAWREVLEEAVKLQAFDTSTLIPVGPELARAFSEPKHGFPLSLNCVLDVMVADGTLLPLPYFDRTYTSSHPTRSSLPLRALSWARNRLGSSEWAAATVGSNGDAVLKQVEYVNLPVVKRLAAQLVRELDELATAEGNSQISQIFNASTLPQILPRWTAEDLLVCLAYAGATQQLYYDRAQDIVKLKAAGVITEADRSVVALRTHLSALAAREQSLTDQVAGYTAQAKEALKTSRKSAKLILQKRVIAETSLERTVAVQHELETVLRKIDDASDNRQAVLAYKQSSRLLSQLNTELNPTDVDDVVEWLHDELDHTNEVTAQLAELSIAAEELEIDNELEQIAQEEAKKEGAEQQAKEEKVAEENKAAVMLARMPDAPSHIPERERVPN